MWTAYVQHTEYSNVIDSISKEKSNNLRLYVDNNRLIKCKHRLDNAEICEGFRYPLLLPKYHRYTDLVIQYCHDRAFHTSCLRLGLSWFNWWVSFAPEFQCCYFCEPSCLFYLIFNFDFYVSKIMHL